MVRILIAESLDLGILESIEESEADIYLHFSEIQESVYSENGIHFRYWPDISQKELLKHIPDYQGLIVRPKTVSKEVIEAGQDLKLIIRGGAGVNTIDVSAATQNGIAVLNTPDQNSIATAEYTFALMMELAAKRNVREAHDAVIKGKPKPVEDYTGNELATQHLALVGFGNIGKAVAKRARAFDMPVKVYSRSLTPEQAKEHGVEFAASLEELLNSDMNILSLHVPLTDQTHYLLNEETFSWLARHENTILINTARPQLIEPKPLADALENDVIQSFAIDGDLDLLEPFQRIQTKKERILTHHIADCTREALAKITAHTIQQLLVFFRSGEAINNVNPGYIQNLKG